LTIKLYCFLECDQSRRKFEALWGRMMKKFRKESNPEPVFPLKCFLGLTCKCVARTDKVNVVFSENVIEALETDLWRFEC
jgi:hypothetical protein